MISISDATKRGVSKLAREAAKGKGHEQILIRNNKPVAAVVGMDRLEQLDELERIEEDLLDIALATTRMLSDSGKRHTFDEVLRHFGFTRADLRETVE
ncbi:MAG: prevent-host-death family protein [Chloroflexi bacterium]|nr:prevent-host-death family protein [Chloroflexota bacterium]